MTDTPKEPPPPPPDQPTLWNDPPETDEPAPNEPATTDSSPWIAEPEEPALWDESSGRWDDEPDAPRDEPVAWNEPSGRRPEAEEPADEPTSWNESAGQWDEADEPVRWDEVSARRDEAGEPVAAEGEAAEPATPNEAAPWHEAYEPAAAAEPAEPAAVAEPVEPVEPAAAEGEAAESEAGQPVPVDVEKRKRISGAGVVIGVLLALLGFALVVQVKSNTTDNAYASAREGDLLQIMSDLDSAERRLQQDIASLQATKRELASGAAGQEAAQEAAKARADDLGILAGTLQARGPGVEVRIDEVTGTIKASSLLNAVQELRGGGAEAIQIDGSGGSVRVIASTSFVDSDGGIRVDGRRLTGPYTIIAIGDPDTLSDAVQFAGGVVPRVRTDGGNVIVNKRDMVEIKEVRPAPSLEFARPVS